MTLSSHFQQAANDHGLLLKSWTFPANGNGIDTAGPAIAGSGVAPLAANSNSYAFTASPVSPGATAPGQNNATPPMLFNNHQVLNVDGVLYDPSYGIIYNSGKTPQQNIQAFESKSVAGFFNLYTDQVTGNREYYMQQDIPNGNNLTATYNTVSGG